MSRAIDGDGHGRRRPFPGECGRGRTPRGDGAAAPSRSPSRGSPTVGGGTRAPSATRRRTTSRTRSTSRWCRSASRRSTAPTCSSTRCLASIRRQTYPNLQIVVVGDHCTDDTERRLAAIRDDWLVFENLEVRGPYPREGQPRSHVAGTYAMNRGLELAEGHFVCHLDDDDEIVHTWIERMLRAAQASRAEFLWHRFAWEVGDGQWKTLGGAAPLIRTMTSGSIFYHRVFTSIRWDVRCVQAERTRGLAPRAAASWPSRHVLRLRPRRAHPALPRACPGPGRPQAGRGVPALDDRRVPR